MAKTPALATEPHTFAAAVIIHPRRLAARGIRARLTTVSDDLLLTLKTTFGYDTLRPL